MSMSAATKAEIKRLEDQRFQAMIDSDFDTLEKLLGDHLVYTHSSSQSDNRAEYIALCKKGVFKYLKIERPVENMQVYGDNTVVVTGQIKIDAVIEGKPKLLNSRYTDVWVKGPTGWQMVVWQSTPIPAH
jgi:ketosteroid isomerase-like protein